MNNPALLNVAKEFSPYPAGRTEDDGPYNGTTFREKFLLPRTRSAIAGGYKLVVELDGLRSFGSSFLEEAFGGLIRAGLSRKALAEHLSVTYKEPYMARYADAIERYLAEAVSSA